MAEEFGVGDVVKLKSDGPDMTVFDGSNRDDHVWCQWFGGRKLEKGRFPIVSLIPVIAEDDK